MKNDRKIFLYAITGLSPAVLTETIWCLAMQKIPVFPDRLIVFTTQTGKEKLTELVNEHWKNMINAIKKKNIEIPYHMENWQSGWINVFEYRDKSGARHNLDDVRTQSDNLEIAEYMFRQIKNDISDEFERPTIYASIAGGRKTMGAMLHSIVSLVGKEDDKIFHILTDKDPPRDFAYPGCKSDEKYKINLNFAEVPFVPLYNILKRNTLARGTTYKSLIQDLSDSINKRMCKIRTNAHECTLTVEIGEDVIEIKLRYVEFLIASTFFRRAKECKYINGSLINDTSYNFKKATENESDYEKDLRSEYNNVKSEIKKERVPGSIDCEDIRQQKGDLRRKLKQKIGDKLTDLIIPVKKTYSEIPPENIVFEDYK